MVFFLMTYLSYQSSLYSLNSLRLYFCMGPSFMIFFSLYTLKFFYIICSDFFLYSQCNPFKWWKRSKKNSNNIMHGKFDSWELTGSVQEMMLKEDRQWKIKRNSINLRPCKHSMDFLNLKKVPWFQNYLGIGWLPHLEDAENRLMYWIVGWTFEICPIWYPVSLSSAVLSHLTSCHFVNQNCSAFCFLYPIFILLTSFQAVK